MRKIFAMGGGGFLMEPDNLALDKFILKLSEKTKPKIALVPTASGDSESVIKRFYDAYSTLPCEPSHLSLYKPPTDLEEFVNEQDILFVSGGNTKNLLALWKEWSLDLIIKSAYQRGLILSGVSAGMICWFEEGVTDSYGKHLKPLKCLGWLKGSACPHFDGEAERRPTFTSLIQKNEMNGGIALDDGAGALYINEKLSECVSSRPHAKAYLFTAPNAHEECLSVRFLG